ncbi:cyclodeaminase/cyclohydrolase family protein [Leeuwenhoekiella sp.]|uniref:cyclodeaminase/cyclohydrolase family protein n=1 Tax=Leeuwenhoekiella sp. TaxID=1977054 RepID=UPI000C4A3AB8|nr:cyclodeaminase/cyclohydrolase family protein [Leeuwenhoekiella sp.]MBA82683.1 methenyltetrahydrofolate cyclohydrolase [Leeuwenhoekiella sp.]|tara:strand:- start:100979 stop:102394 length:1416 start_codon:yes stop_codon:yes gene_type:complete
MDIPLLGITIKKLLEKIGAGNHKPGSGSAAALQAMVSSKLLATVIDITNDDDHRQFYLESLPTLLLMDKAIRERIFPRLCELFQLDSTQFDKTITLRKARNKEKNPIKKNQFSQDALKELKVSIEIPIEIAKLSIELSRISEFVFDNAFQSARGDSQVALNGSISALGGCISIIDLNLLSYGINDLSYTQKINQEVDRLKSEYNRLNKISTSKIDSLSTEVNSNIEIQSKVNKLLSNLKGKKKVLDSDIEKYVIEFQEILWVHKDDIWKKNKPENLIEVLNPKIAFKKILGYDFYETSQIPKDKENREELELAGIIDQTKRLVLISNDFPNATKNFTAAHELGHAFMHNNLVMHRDMSLESSSKLTRRDYKEIQADKFASFFLMPKEQVINSFKNKFLTNQFIINEDSTFLLNGGSPSILRSECKNIRGLSRKLASVEFYASKPFTSLADTFNVSKEAMAIRLEELNLVHF